MTEPEIIAALTPIFRTVLGDAAIVLRPETTPRDFAGWDSFRYIEIILKVEEELGVKIRSREANRLANIGELVALIRAKRG